MEQKKVKVRYKGQRVYVCAQFSCRPGEIVEVDERKAEQLLRDFPGDWEVVRPGPKSKKKEE